MDAEDIKRQRDFLDDSHRAGTGRGTCQVAETAKACHGCGRGRDPNAKELSRIYWRRPPDRVCNECRQLIYEALASHEEKAAQTDHRLYFVESRGFYEGHYPHKTGWIHDVPFAEWTDRMGQKGHPALDPAEVIEKCLARLAESLSADLPTEGQTTTDSVYPREKSSFHSPRGRRLWLRPEHALLLRTLDVAIRQALIDRSEAGEDHGRNLLLQLATGELSVQKFNDATTKKNT